MSSLPYARRRSSHDRRCTGLPRRAGPRNSLGPLYFVMSLAGRADARDRLRMALGAGRGGCGGSAARGMLGVDGTINRIGWPGFVVRAISDIVFGVRRHSRRGVVGVPVLLAAAL